MRAVEHTYPARREDTARESSCPGARHVNIAAFFPEARVSQENTPPAKPRHEDAPDRQLTVPPELGGRPLDGVLKTLLETSWTKARELLESGKVRLRGATVTDGKRPIRAGETLAIHMRAPRPERARLLAVEEQLVVYLDATLVVVRKPPGIATVPFGDETPSEARGTLDALVREVVARRDAIRGRAPLGVVQRLDKGTTGLLVFARTLAAKKHLAQQLREHTVHREYRAIVHGNPSDRVIRTHLLEDRGDGLRGSAERLAQRLGRVIRGGQLAVTHVRVLEQLGGAALVACRLETGRTHQIRIHLAEAGHPLVGEDVYLRDYGGTMIPAARPMLHAAELGFEHPLDERPMHFEDPLPDDMRALVERLRRAAPAAPSPPVAQAARATPATRTTPRAAKRPRPGR